MATVRTSQYQIAQSLSSDNIWDEHKKTPDKCVQQIVTIGYILADLANSKTREIIFIFYLNLASYSTGTSLKTDDVRNDAIKMQKQ